jgi:DNA-binding MarR family transcriptional regulator
MADPAQLSSTIDIITRTIAQMQGQALREHAFVELSLRQVSCLDLIQRDAEPTPADLARSLGITRPSVSALIARLLAAGLIRKERSQQDARSFHVHLTEKGAALMQAHQRVHEAIARRLLVGLDAGEQQQLADLLEKIAAHVR